MTITQVEVKKNIYGRINEYKLLISPLKDFGFCSGCKKDQQDLFLTLNQRETKKIKGKKQEIDNILQYCYDCASNELTKLSRKNITFKSFDFKGKQEVISKALGEMAYLQQREKGEMVDKNGEPIPNKYELQNELELKKQKKKTKDKDEEDKYIYHVDEDRNELMEKTEQINQAYEKKWGHKIPSGIARYRSAFYAPKSTDEPFGQEGEPSSSFKDSLLTGKLDHCYHCGKEYQETKNKWYLEENPLASIKGDKRIYCFECVDEAQVQLNDLKEFNIADRGSGKSKNTLIKLLTDARCDECNDCIDILFLNDNNQREEYLAGNRVYCEKCLSKVKKGIFSCYESHCPRKVDTRGIYGSGRSHFGIDLNHNIFCESCWTFSKQEKEAQAIINSEGIKEQFKKDQEWYNRGLKSLNKCSCSYNELKDKILNNSPNVSVEEYKKYLNYLREEKQKTLIDLMIAKVENRLREKNLLCNCSKNYINQPSIQKQESGKLSNCLWRGREFYDKPLCPEHRELRNQDNEVHHGTKAPDGKCQQCLREVPIAKIWNDKYYCKDCLEWNEEANKSGVGNYCQRFRESWCGSSENQKGCGKYKECNSCWARKKLVGISTRDLMIEVMTRDEFEALLTWEDDGFKQRYGEIMWELTQVKGLSPDKIEKLVNKDIFEKKLSQRKFSRGT